VFGRVAPGTCRSDVNSNSNGGRFVVGGAAWAGGGRQKLLLRAS